MPASFLRSLCRRLQVAPTRRRAPLDADFPPASSWATARLGNPLARRHRTDRLLSRIQIGDRAVAIGMRTALTNSLLPKAVRAGIPQSRASVDQPRRSSFLQSAFA